MPTSTPHWPTKVASLALPTREAQVVAAVWPRGASTLLFLAEINLTLAARQDFTAALTQTIERAWAELVPEDETADAALERILLQLNPVLKAHERLLGNPLAPRYHLCLAVLRDQSLALSHVGHVGALVVTPNRITSVLNPAQHNTSKPFFQHLVEGTIEPGETILLANSSLFDFFSTERIQHTIGNMAPGIALREVENIVTALEHHPPLAIIALRLVATAETELSTQSSIDKLLETQDQTSSLLSPKLWPSLLTRLWPRRAAKPATPPVPILRPRAALLKEDLEVEPELPVRMHGNVWQRFIGLFHKLAWLGSREEITNTVTWWFEAKITAWRRLPISKRVVLGLAAIALIAFSQSIVSLGKQKLTAHSSAQYDQRISAITQLRAEAESALIYHDDAKALDRWNQAEILLKELPQTTDDQKQTYQSISDTLAALNQRLQHIVTVTNVSPWAQLPAGEWAGLASLNNSLYTFNAAGQVASVSNKAKVQTSFSLPKDFSTPKAIWALDKAILFQNNANALITLDPTTNKTAVVAEKLSTLDADWYNGKLYYLTQGDSPALMVAAYANQIFSTPKVWLKPPLKNIPGGSAMAIDGNLYVASTEHTIQKFTRGQERDFITTPPAPPLTHPTLLRTTMNGAYVYLADAASQRVLIYNKQGKLVVQLDLKALGTPSALSIDAKDTYLYLLIKNQIYRLKTTDYTAK